MDDRLQMMGNITHEQLHQFEQERLQKEQTLLEHIKKRDEFAELDAKTLLTRYKKQQPQAEVRENVVEDMPQQVVDEKESKRIRREKSQFKSQTKLLQRNRKEKAKSNPEEQRALQMQQNNQMDDTAKEIFRETLRSDMFTPRYVLEHFAEVREKLDSWKEHIRLFDQGGAGNYLTTKDQDLRLVKMREMYQQGELAFRAALGALGYRYDAGQKGTSMIQEMRDPERKQAALEENRALRAQLAEGAARMDDEVADELIALVSQRVDLQMEEMRNGMAETQQFGFIHTDKFSQIYQYEEMEKAKNLIEAHPQEYAQNQEMVDQLYEELFRLMEVVGVHYQDAFKIMEIQSADKTLSRSKAAVEVERRLEEHQEKMSIIRHRAEAMKAGMRFLLEGRQPDETLSYVLKDFIPLQDVHQQRRVETAEQAGVYANSYRNKQEIFQQSAKEMFGDQAKKMTDGVNGRFMMLMEPGEQLHNEAALQALQVKKTLQDQGTNPEKSKELGRVLKPLVLPYLERMKNFDTKMLENCTPEELIARTEELQDLYISGMQVADLAKTVDPDDPEGRSIKDAFCGEDKELFVLKCSAIQSHALRARAFSLIKAYKQGSLDESAFTKTEIDKLRTKMELNGQEPLTKEQFLFAAKNMLEMAETSKNAAYNAYFKSPKIKASVLKGVDLQIKTTHPGYQGKLQQIRELCAENSHKPVESVNANHVKEFYEKCDNRIKEIEQELNTMEEPGMAALELQEELEKTRENKEYARMLQALTMTGGYMRAGDQMSLLGEPMFRSYDSSEGMPVIQAMSEEEFTLMCKKMSAGTFEDQSDPVQREAYYQENLEGLQIYKERIRQHYEMLEARFHHQVPSLEYIMEHEQEIQRLFANLQVDTHFVRGMRDVVDLTKPEDLRLYHLVNFYNAMMGFMSNIKNTASLVCKDYQEAKEGLYIVLRQEDVSRQYLEQAPEQDAQAVQRSEKFRQVAEDAPLLLQGDQAVLESYLPRVMELAEYVEQHKKDTSLEMEQYKGWLELIQRRLKVAAQGFYHSIEQMENHEEVLNSPETYAKELESGDVHRFLNAIMEFSKICLTLQIPNLSSDDRYQMQEKGPLKAYLDVDGEKAIDALEKKPKEFVIPFVEAYYQKKETLVDRMEQEITRIMPELPETMEEKDRKLLATHLVMQTKLGREYDSLNTISQNYFKNDNVHEVLEDYLDRNLEKMERKIGPMDQQINDAYIKYEKLFVSTGFSLGVGEERLAEFNSKIK